MAKPFAGRRDDRRPALFDPVQEQLARRVRITFERPRHFDFPRRQRQSPVLDCVRRQFVDCKSNCLRGFRANDNVGSTKLKARTLNVDEGLKVLAREVGERGSLPTVKN